MRKKQDNKEIGVSKMGNTNKYMTHLDQLYPKKTRVRIKNIKIIIKKKEMKSSAQDIPIRLWRQAFDHTFQCSCSYLFIKLEMQRKQ